MYQAKDDFVKVKSSERDQGRRWLVSMHHLSCKHGPMGRLAGNRMHCWGHIVLKTGLQVLIGQQTGAGVGMRFGCIGDNASASICKHNEDVVGIGLSLCSDDLHWQP